MGWCGPCLGSCGAATRSSFRLGPTRVPGTGRCRHRTGHGGAPTGAQGGRCLTFSSSVAFVLKLGLRLELYRSPTVQVPVRPRATRRGARLPLGVDGRGVRRRRLTPLAVHRGTTERIKLGTAVVQLAGRPPAMLGMQAMTIDAIAGGGRMIIGIGLSGPQIVEGWYGQPWGKPNARLRDYVEILRDVLRREASGHPRRPGDLAAVHRGPGALGQGKPLKSILHAPVRHPDLVGVGRPDEHRAVPPSCATAGCRWACRRGTGDPDVATRWPPGSPAPTATARPGADFDVFNGLTVKITDDVKGWLDSIRPYRATYVGGMGSAVAQLPRRVDGQARLRRRRPRASRSCSSPADARRPIAAMPDEALLQGTLVGTPASIRAAVGRGRHRAPRRHRRRSWAPTGPTSSSWSQSSPEHETECGKMPERLARRLGSDARRPASSAAPPGARWAGPSGWPSTTARASSTRRARIDALVDPGSFLELGTLVGGDEAPAEAIVLGSGSVERSPGDRRGRGLHRDGGHDQPHRATRSATASPRLALARPRAAA